MAAPQYPLSDLFKYAGGMAVNDPGADPELQYFLSKGYLSAQASGGEGGAGQTIYSFNDKVIPTASNGAKFGTFWQPEGISGADHAINPNAVIDDPNYGKITSNQNIYHEGEHDFMAKATPYLEALMSAGFGGFAAMEGFGLQGLAGTAFKFAGSEILNGGQNPFASLFNSGSKNSGSPNLNSGNGNSGDGNSGFDTSALQTLIALLRSALGNGKTGG